MPIIKKLMVFCFTFLIFLSVEELQLKIFLAQLSESVVFLDRTFVNNANKWNTSSPQHIDGISLNRLFKDKSFFDFYFAIVRDPISRYKSVFMFQKHNENKISKDISINEHISLIKNEKISLFGYCDNHFLPMVNFFYAKY